MKPTTASLSKFNQTLRDYQEDVLKDALDFSDRVLDRSVVPAGNGALAPGAARRRGYTSPTGTGKSTCILAIAKVLSQSNTLRICTPSLDIIRGFLEKCGAEGLDDAGEAELWREAEACGITTPTRLRNAIIEGREPPPDVLILDELHHAVETNVIAGDLLACCPYSVVFGFSACSYRGSPEGTKQLNSTWGSIVEVMNFREAVRDGYAALPDCHVVGLLDDDVIKVVAGEFAAKAVNKEMLQTSRINALAELVAMFVDVSLFDGPTMVALPSGETTRALKVTLEALGVASHVVLKDTTPLERSRAYADCRERRAALLQVSVVGEGVDFPWLQRLIDARPTLSPVKWVQQFGRITRPSMWREYVCVCRNLERFAYLLGGLLPIATIRKAQEEFGGPTRSAIARHVGLESLGRFKATPVPLYDGRIASLWCVYSVEDGLKREWAALAIPGQADPLVASREIQKLEFCPACGGSGKQPQLKMADGCTRVPQAPCMPCHGTGEGPYNYAAKPKWVRQAAPPESFEGFASTSNSGKLSDPQIAWWDRCAGQKGLAVPALASGITRRAFAALPVLVDTGLRVAL